MMRIQLSVLLLICLEDNVTKLTNFSDSIVFVTASLQLLMYYTVYS